MGDGARVVGVHREALVGVVGGRAEALVLLDDRRRRSARATPRRARTNASRPIAWRLGALLREQLLDLDLRRDAGVVGAEDPLRPPPLHAPQADQRVLDRPVERVAHVQRAGHVRRRDGDRVGLRRTPSGSGLKTPSRPPSARTPARSTSAGVVAGALARAASARPVAPPRRVYERGPGERLAVRSRSPRQRGQRAHELRRTGACPGAAGRGRSRRPPGSSAASRRADSRLRAGSGVKYGGGSCRPGRRS